MWVQQKPTKQQHGKDAGKAKADLRLRVLEHISPAHVFDAFCGDGGMFRAAWHKATSYVGCDLKFWPPAPDDARRRFVADNIRVMRAINLQAFNVFDLDAYGSPWEHMIILAARRKWSKGERGAVILTDGTALKMRFGQLPQAVAQLCGMSKDRLPPSDETGTAAQEMALRAWAHQSGVEILKQWRAEGRGSGKGGMRMVYTAIVFEGK